FVAEDEIDQLPSLLREREPRWREMGERALEAYETHFRPEVFARRAVEQIVALYRTRTHDERDFFSQWDRIIHEAEEERGQGSRTCSRCLAEPLSRRHRAPRRPFSQGQPHGPIAIDMIHLVPAEGHRRPAVPPEDQLPPVLEDIVARVDAGARHAAV